LRILADRIGVPEERLADLACREVPARLAGAYPNLYASIAATINFVARSPRQFAEWIGKLMFWCGEDKIIYGSEAPIWHPKWALEAFWNFEIPQDLVEGYGYPQLTERAKRKILGENLMRLSGMDPDETRQRLARVS